MTTPPSPEHQDNLKAIRIMVACFLICFLFWCMLGCATKEKAKQSKVYIEQVAKREMHNLILKNQKESVELVNTISEAKVDTEIAKFDGKIADPTKPATFQEKKEPGKITRVWENFTEVKTDTESKQEQTIDSLSQSITEKDETIAELQQKLEDNSKIQAKTKALDLETKRTSTFVTIGIGAGIFCILILLFLFLYFRIKRNKMSS